MTIPLDHWTCYEVPAGLKNKVSSIRMKADICVELHSKSKCSEEGGLLPLRLRRSVPPTAINLADWDFLDKTLSISLCGLSCRRNQNASRITVKATSDLDPIPRCPHITIYDEKDFTGMQNNCTTNIYF